MLSAPVREKNDGSFNSVVDFTLKELCIVTVQLLPPKRNAALTLPPTFLIREVWFVQTPIN